MENKTITQIQTQINEIKNQQLQIQKELINIEQVEMEFYETKESNRKIIDRLFYFWKMDKEMNNRLEQEFTKLEFYNKKIQTELDKKRNALLKEKEDLEHVEIELNKKLQSIYYD